MFLLFEVGGTKTRIGFSSDGENLESPEIIPSFAEFEQFLKALKEKSAKFGKIDSICGGLPVVFDKDGSTILQSAHLPKLIGKNVKEQFQQVFEASIFLDNETSLAALGEAKKGAGSKYPIVAFLTVGTGVGSSRIVDGKMDRKSFGFEVGHQIIIPDGDLCTCGGKGHLETYVGGSYLEKKYNQKGEDIKDPKIWDEITRFLAIGLYNCSVHWSPDIFVLGGAVMQSIPLNKLKAYLQQFSTIFPKTAEITLSTLGELSGLYGALEYIKQRNA